MADRMLAEIVARLKETGLYGRSLLLVTSDHGVSLSPGTPLRVVRPRTLGEIAPVPFFLKLPGQTHALISDVPAQLIDVLPTIVDVLRMEIPWAVEGRSLLGARSSPQRRMFYRLRIDDDGADVRAAVRRKYEIFGREDGSIDPFAIGPGDAAQLIGTPVSRLRRAVRGSQFVHLPYAHEYSAWNPRTDFLPVLLEGTVHGLTKEQRVTLAVAVGGRIAAVTRTYVNPEGGMSFHSLLPPESLVAATNDIEVFEVNDAAGRVVTRLRPAPD